ncbi:MAG TPA: APC family permease [Gammaproteobacteria bacterium]|nr:APC family permease [Gammaproteobacteria bacterium]
MTRHKLRKEAGPIGLLYASLGGMIGSGWLFGALHAAKLAGPLSIWSWVIGAVAVLLLALVYSELVTLLPKSGALVHLSHLSHGDLLGRIWGWILFLGYVSIAPVEVMAVLTYTNNYLPGMVQPQTGLLTHLGFVVAIVFLALIVTLNLLAIRWVLWINSAVTWWKIAVPVLTVVVLLAYSHHPENLHAAAGHYEISGIFTAVASAGVIFSFLGFRQAIDLAGETDNPARNIPLAVIGSVVIAAVIYIGLQFAFLLALNPADIGNDWRTLHFEGVSGPLAALSVSVGATWWAIVLYADAIASPTGTGFIYSTASSRITMAGGEMHTLPRSLAEVNARGVPLRALIVTFVAGAIFFFPFPSWQKLVSYISSVTVLSYGLGPIVLLHLRRTVPDAPRAFRLGWAWLVAPAAFVISNWIILWTGFKTANVLFGMIALMFVTYTAYHYLFKRGPRGPFGWPQIAWVFPYFGGLWLLLYYGPPVLGGNGTLGFGMDMLLSAVFSVLIMALAVATGVPAETSSDYLAQMTSEAEEAAP